MMNLYLVRHAEAMGIGGAVVRDADRPLTVEGEGTAMLMGKVLARLEQGPVVCASSPLLRARRTMDLLCQGFATSPPCEVWEDLAPGVSYRGLTAKLAGRPDGAYVLIGHQPDMANLLAYLVADAAVEVVLPPCGMAFLSAVSGSGLSGSRLHWVLTPEVVRVLHPGL